MKALGSITIVLLALGILLVPLIWFQTEEVGEQRTREVIEQESAVEFIEHRFENTLDYVEESLYIAGMLGTENASTESGRVEEDLHARYWMCNNIPQIPPVDKVRDTAANFSTRNMERIIDDFVGVRDDIVYDVSPTECIETGYPEELEEIGPRNETFPKTFSNEHIEVSRADGEIIQRAEDIEMSRNMSYNRFWYMYRILSEWTQDETIEEHIAEELNYVPDIWVEEKTICGECSECPFPIGEPHICESQHYHELTRLINNGLEREMERLETHEDFFNNTGVICNAEPNFRQDPPPDPTCYTQEFEYENNCIETDTECSENKKETICETIWRTIPTVHLDVTVTCTDDRNKPLPKEEDKDQLTWQINLNYNNIEPENPSAQDNPVPDTCQNPAEGAKPSLELFRQCESDPPDTSYCQLPSNIDQVNPCENEMDVEY